MPLLFRVQHRLLPVVIFSDDELHVGQGDSAFWSGAGTDSPPGKERLGRVLMKVAHAGKIVEITRHESELVDGFPGIAGLFLLYHQRAPEVDNAERFPAGLLFIARRQAQGFEERVAETYV